MKASLLFVSCMGSVLPAAVLYAGDDPDAMEILRKADANTKAVKVVSYDAQYYGEGDSRFMRRAVKVRGKVIAREARRSLMTNIFGGSSEIVRYEGEIQLPGTDEWIPFLIACDGRTVYRIDPSSKTYTRGSLPHAGQLLRRGSTLLMMEYVHPTPFSDELNGKKAVYEGEQEVGGVDCYVIYVVYRDNSESRWYFGKEDYLPRRVDRISGAASQNAQIRVLTNLNTNPEIDIGTFRLSMPDGFVERRFEIDGEEGFLSRLLAPGSPAPNFEIKTTDGKVVRLKDLRGHVVVLDFWATWCGPCRLAMPGVQRLHEKYREKPVKVFGISTWEQSSADPEQFMADGNYTYGLLLGGDDVAEEYKLEGLPTFYIIDPEGRVLYASTGFLPDKEDEISEVIDKALKATSGSDDE